YRGIQEIRKSAGIFGAYLTMVAAPNTYIVAPNTHIAFFNIFFMNKIPFLLSSILFKQNRFAFPYKSFYKTGAISNIIFQKLLYFCSNLFVRCNVT
ncbi:MAG: hypothetical protein ACLTWG_15450, partial [Blautia sp.]|uniref:hypothetical protein n=1 Tax=Blautia sp. TaxID=1955243 RepID=UPI0039942278